MKKTQVIVLALATFIIGILLGRFVLIAFPATEEAACDQECQLQANITKCEEIIPKLETYLAAQNSMVKTNYEDNRLIFMDFFKYLDGLYYETYSEVNLNQQSIRDTLYQASERSSELYKESSTTNDPVALTDIQAMLEQNIQNINFYSEELKKSCAEIKP
jgi:uncharacterized membrane-anchored protein YhcB (DUF1043 family)